MRFRSFVNVEEIPMSGLILARVSDNVLEERDGSTMLLAVQDGVVESVDAYIKGVYAYTGLRIGMTIEELAKWSQWNSTGQHPENYYELKF